MTSSPSDSQDAVSATPTDGAHAVPHATAVPAGVLPDVPEGVSQGDWLADQDRYRVHAHIGSGSTSEVFRVRDLLLERDLAMKVLRSARASRTELRDRFIAEARALARLQHPGILPVYDVGELPDGRPYYTMQEVLGENLEQVLHRRHQVTEVADLWPLSRLLTVFRQACSIVAFAHVRQVLHLDLQPINLLVGEQDAVYVVDWGLTVDDGSRRAELVGTPAFLAPEQLDAVGPPLDARVDVYALGAVLYQILTGQPPYVGTPEQVLEGLRNAPPVSVQAVAPSIPEPLARIVERAMARTPDRRYASAEELGQAVDTWLDGSETRKRVHRLVEMAESRVDDARLLLGRAERLRTRAEQVEAGLAPWDAEQQKHDLWDMEDRADVLELEARYKLLERRQLLHAATTQAPEAPRPRAILAGCFREDHDEAEARGDEATRRMSEERLREHLGKLPEAHPVRQEYLDWLSGMGALSLDLERPAVADSTDAQPVEIVLERYANYRRRLHLVPGPELGEGALAAVPLPMGSYRLRIAAPGCAEVLLPVQIARGAHWRMQRDVDGPVLPLHLPLAETIGPEDCYIPAGHALVSDGADRFVSVWIDGVVMRRNPVTNLEYLAFLNHLVAEGQAAEAQRWAPLGHAPAAGASPTWKPAADGFYALDERLYARGVPDAPVVGVSWYAAKAYACWEAMQTGLAWRLPHELEWEKAARGVDARVLPWGAGPDPSRACVWLSRASPDGPASVQHFPADESPYGCRHLAGNVHEWCENVFRAGGRVQGDAITWSDGDAGALRTARGASWRSRGLERALSQRQGLDPAAQEDRVGFRLARSFEPVPDRRT